MKCIFAQIFAIEDGIVQLFKRFSAEKFENFDFSTKFQDSQNDVYMHQMHSKTLFIDSKDSVDIFLYLDGAPRTNTDDHVLL